MKKLLTASSLILLGLLSMVSVSARAADAATPPDQIAREATDKILSSIKANRDTYAKDHKKLFGMVNDQLQPYVEFRKVAQQVLGPTWRSATEEQRNRFTSEFSSLLVRTYGTALLKFNDQKITYQPLKSVEGDRTAVVKSTIVRTGGAPPVAINYSFMKTDGGWKVYDMAIEGPSIVTTYQRVYAERLRSSGGLDAVIDNLAQENKRAETGGAAAAATAGQTGSAGSADESNAK